MKTFFAEIILPLALPNTFTYRLPRNMEAFAEPGMRVVVPFGKKTKLLTGIVYEIHERAPRERSVKYIDALLDNFPVVTERQLRFWDWLAAYYMCTRGEVLAAALPAGLRLSSESRYIINPAFDGDLEEFSEREIGLIEALSAREMMTADEVSDFLEIKTVQPVLKKLLESGAVLIFEDLREKYKPKKETFVRLAPGCSDEDGLRAAFDSLERAPKQLEVLMTFVQLTGAYRGGEAELKAGVLRKHAGCSGAVIKAISRKGIFETEERQTDRIRPDAADPDARLVLSPAQQAADAGIEAAFSERRKTGKNPVVLLEGVTGSGKTEIYIKRIKDELDAGRQVLYLLPEIALTTQIILRLQRYFGEKTVVYHSRFNQNERVEVWQKVRKNNAGQGCVVLGARSAVFLPFNSLGLVIVDEEHETSFKQFDPAPRYNGRDAAILLGSLFDIPVLLGSATPSVESLYNAEKGKYARVSLSERYGGIALPEIVPALLNRQTAPSGYFTTALIEHMERALQRKEQVILFQNRRGYAPVLVCESCGWSPECVRCDVSATYHKAADRLVCHYCGNKYNLPPVCPSCGSHKLKLAGFGTERIEEELPVFFPDAKTARLDYDSTRSKYAYLRILSDFEDRNTDILIGTQMVTKGLDFDGVSTVGILNADLLLKYPDFRATERAFQLITQVAGRAGRRGKRGKVFVQTREPDSLVMQRIIAGDYASVYRDEIAERRQFGYPPFTRLILFTLKHREAELIDFCAAGLAVELRTFLPESSVLGPEYPHVARIKNRYHKQIMLKITPDMALSETKRRLRDLTGAFFARKEFRAVRLSIDVDPY